MLLDKYFDAETTLEEEQVLQDYFSSNEVAIELQEYIPLFNFRKIERDIEFNHSLPKRGNQGLYKWFAVAASIAIIGGLFLFNDIKNEPELGTYEDPQVALQKTKDVLNMVSFYMNQGQENLEYVSEFGEVTNKIIKTP